MIELIGADHAEATLGRVSGRMLNLTPGMAAISLELEASEQAVFAGLGGKYVDTGATIQSLTSTGGQDAIRRPTPWGLEFGSAVPYARFLVEDPGPETPAGGLQRSGHPSAILKLDPEVAEGLAKTTMEYVTREGLL